MKYFIIRISISLVASIIFFFSATALANNVDMESVVSHGNIAGLFSSGAAVIGLMGLAFGYILFCIGYIFNGIWGLIRHIGIWSVLAFIAVIVILPTGVFITYNSTMSTMHTKFSSSLNTVLDKKYGSKIKSNALEKLNNLKGSELKDVEKKSGLSKTQIQEMINKGQYSELIKKLPKDSGININKELENRGIDPNSPLIKTLMGSK